MKIFLGAVALVFAVFLLPEEQLGLEGQVGQISLAVVGILAFPIATAFAILRPSGQASDRTLHRFERDRGGELGGLGA